MIRRQQLKEAIPPNPTPGERSDNASSGPSSLFLVFLAKNWVENATIRPLSPNWSNYFSNKNMLSAV